MVVPCVCYCLLLSMNLWAEFLPSRRRGILLNALSVRIDNESRKIQKHIFILTVVLLPMGVSQIHVSRDAN